MGIEKIVSGNYCIGCGACAIHPSNGIEISFDQYGKYQANVVNVFSDLTTGNAMLVCPFSDEAENEDQIGSHLYSGEQHDDRFGFYRSLHIGYVAEGEYREKATSGGIITWLLTELLETKRIDGVIHVKRADPSASGCLFEYAISKDAASVLAGAKSRYYPVETSKVLSYVRENQGRYAFVGVPCFVKAIRNIQKQDPIFSERIKYCIGIVCGHMKSKAFADCFGWQVGIKPGNLEAIDFRVKQDVGTAGDYAVSLKSGDFEITKRSKEFLGSNWGHNFFRYEACDYCDDVLAETADIAIGDAWLPDYNKDPRGTSIIVIRNADIDGLFHEASNCGRLHLESATADKIAMSQEGGLRDRREGLSYRLFLKSKSKQWFPKKRVEPSCVGIPHRRRKIYTHRSLMGRMSHIHWRHATHLGSFDFFEKKMNKLIKKNNSFYRSYWIRFICKVFDRLFR